MRVAVAEYRHTSHGMHSDDQGSPGAEPLAAQQPAPVVEPSPCQLLAQHLGLPAGKLERLLQRQPEMLRVPANRLVMRLQQLSRFMRLPMEQVRCNNAYLPAEVSVGMQHALLGQRAAYIVLSACQSQAVGVAEHDWSWVA